MGVTVTGLDTLDALARVDITREGRVSAAERVADAVRTEAPRRTSALVRSVAVDRDAGAVIITAGHAWPVQSGRSAGRRGGAQRPNPYATRGARRADQAAADAVADDLTQQINRIFN